MIKIFKAGKYPQGEFFNVSKLIENVKQIPAILYHTSKHIANGLKETDIPVLGYFNNLQAVNDEIIADFEYTEKGQEYKDDIKHISIEIDKALEKITKVGLLPKGVSPQIKGLSEFEDNLIVCEFEAEKIEGGKTMTIEEILLALDGLDVGQKIEALKKIMSTVTNEDRRAARAIAFEFAEETGLEAKEKIVVTPKSEQEIRTEIKAEFEAQARKEKEMAEFMATVKEKVTPAHQLAYQVAFEKAQAETSVIEFSETEKCTLKEKLTKFVEAMPKSELKAEFAADKKEKEDEFKAAYERTVAKYKK